MELPEPHQDFRDWVKERREQRGLSRQQAADRAGVTLSGWVKFETVEKNNLHIETVKKIAGALVVPLWEAFTVAYPEVAETLNLSKLHVRTLSQLRDLSPRALEHLQTFIDYLHYDQEMRRLKPLVLLQVEREAKERKEKEDL